MKKLLILSFVLLSCINLTAGVTVVSVRQMGAYDAAINPLGIQVGSTSFLQDDQYGFMIANPSTWGDVFTNCDHKNRVILRYEESARVFYASPWEVEVECDLSTYDETGTLQGVESFTLTIEYDPDAGTVYNDKDVYVSTDPGYRTKLEVTNVTLTGLGAVPADIVLETEIEVTRSYFFDQTTTPGSITNSGVLGDNTFNIRWDFLPGAESYDLEFLHVSSYDPVSVATPDFSRATRINTPNQNYTLNLAYDDGYILYRVRGVGYDCGSTFRREGDWSSASSPVAVSDIDQYRNWSYTAVYAEDGKKKEMLSFYDGTGKRRQNVTLNNTDNAVLVGEVMYDYEGRAGIRTLPAPQSQLSSELMYYESFSLVYSTTDPYDRKVFDTDDNFNTLTCTFGAVPGMDDAEGASNYYSPDNDLVNAGMYQSLPDAQFYPFMQTAYGADGRPVKQSIPGDDHKIGSGHETQMMYTSPTQERLDRMFGNEVGYAEHYNQIASIDANGQISMKYLDLSGRTIATSLVGEAPANLDALASNTTTTLNESFNNSNVFDQNAGTWIVNAFYMVTTPGDYEFTYEMTTEEFESICTDTTFDCVYDLEINIYDGCDNPMDDNWVPPTDPHVLGTPYVIDHFTVSNFSQTFTVTFSTPGVYRIEKKLSLNQAALDAAVAAYVALLPGDCFQTLSELNDSLNAAIDSTECLGCDSACIAKGLALGLMGMDLADFVDSCQLHDCTGDEYELGTCDAMLDVFAGDLSPGGQYFDNVPSGTLGLPSITWLETYVWPNTDAPSWADANFLDPSGALIDSWAEMRQYWQNGWATRPFTSTVTTTVTVTSGSYNSLVEFHPEYCHYGWCNLMQDSREFDFQFYQHDDCSWASSTPSGMGNAWTYNPVGGNEEGTNMVNADDYFNTSPGSGDKTAMQALVDDYDGMGTSMWDYADALTTSCDDQWILFRSLYMSAKAQFMRDREESTCGFLCDDDEPIDMYADACSGGETENFMIRVPDLVEILSAQPSSAWNSGSQSIVYCSTPGAGVVDFYYANGEGDCSSGLIGTVELIYDNGVDPPYDITCGLVVLNGGYCMPVVAAMVAAAINSCVTVPYDFTAVVDPLDSNKIIITGPASAGALANGSLTVVLADGPTTGGYKIEGGVTGSGIECIAFEHCFCRELALYEAFYNATNDSSSYSGNYIVDHSVYTTVEDYIAYALNAAYGTSVTDTDVQAWMDNCDASELSDPTDEGNDPLPQQLDCENLQTPCMEDGYDITDYYANYFYEQLIEQATQDFIQDYIDHCFGGDFTENFEVEHEDREYHITLYYFDQAGNLTRTVPPHAVQLLDATETANANAYRTTGSGSPEYPDHAFSSNQLVTNYKYNSFNNPVQTTTPDAGEANYFYDNIGRIVGSQNSKQAAMANYVYNYTFYDPQGRVYEVGQVTSTVTITASVTATESAWETFVAAGTREQVTSTYYDETIDASIAGEFNSGQNYLRQRITSVTIEQTYDGNDLTYDHASHFSYDVHGNVDELIQEYPELEDHDQNMKHVNYQYDLISGNVNQVIYQQGQGDQFIHHYYYDADNRITNVYTSIDGVIWEQDQKYFYYLHGPVGRNETGDVKVQGTDYAYTIHGWIKGVNSNEINRATDLGKDAQATNNTSYTSRAGMHSNIGQDAYGYVLGYYWDNSGAKDYKPINNAAQSLYTNANLLTNPGDDLFNGNIKEMSTALTMPNGTSNPSPVDLIFNRYHYDQLNRIVTQSSFTGAFTSDYTNLSSMDDYTNTFTYDAAGNIATQFRNGYTGPGQSMDDLTYHYYTQMGGTYTMNPDGSAPVNGTNKLAYVDDAGAAGNYGDDLEDQSSGNYTYDEIGNLESDVSEEIDLITWNMYGKIESVTRDALSNKPDLEFIYDAFGQRIVKIVKPRNGFGLENQDEWSYTYYVRDASGMVMATYERTYTEVSIDVVDKLQLSETHLYGSGRIGIRDRESENIYSDVTRTYSTINIDKTYNVTGIAGMTAMMGLDLTTPERILGYKAYELLNHLGNVLVTLSDRKVEVNNGGNIDYFTSDVRSFSDYSAFGASLAGRSGGNYRYGMNGQEKDDEMITGIYSADFWTYDSRLARRLNTDPVIKAWESPYAVFYNNPLRISDPMGATGDDEVCQDEEPAPTSAMEESGTSLDLAPTGTFDMPNQTGQSVEQPSADANPADGGTSTAPVAEQTSFYDAFFGTEPAPVDAERLGAPVNNNGYTESGQSVERSYNGFISRTSPTGGVPQAVVIQTNTYVSVDQGADGQWTAYVSLSDWASPISGSWETTGSVTVVVDGVDQQTYNLEQYQSTYLKAGYHQVGHVTIPLPTSGKVELRVNYGAAAKSPAGRSVPTRDFLGVWPIDMDQTFPLN